MHFPAQDRISVFRGKMAARMAEGSGMPRLSEETLAIVPFCDRLGSKRGISWTHRYHSQGQQLYRHLCSPVHLKLAVFCSNDRFGSTARKRKTENDLPMSTPTCTDLGGSNLPCTLWRMSLPNKTYLAIVAYPSWCTPHLQNMQYPVGVNSFKGLREVN